MQAGLAVMVRTKSRAGLIIQQVIHRVIHQITQRVIQWS